MIRHHRNSQRGNVVLEFALSISLLVLLLFGTFQFGFAFYQYNSLVNAIRNGTRYASMAKISNQGNGVIPAEYFTAIRNTVIYGNPNPGESDAPIVRGITTRDVEVIVGFDVKFVPQTVTVRVSKFEIDAVLRKFVINNKPSLQMPFTGQYCPVGC